MQRELNDIMEFDHPIRVNPDGTIDPDPRKSHPGTPYAPESVMQTRHDGQVDDGDEEAWIESIRRQGWEPERGWTGQHGYRGPVMHASEYVGGGLEDHIRETPGLWVVVSVECLPDEDPDPDDEDHDPADCETCERRDCGDFEPAGWAVLHMDDGPETAGYVVSLERGEPTRAYTSKLARTDLAEARKAAALARPILKDSLVRIVRVTDLTIMPDEPTPAERLEVLRAALRSQDISMGELIELQNLAEHIQPGDTELLEAAGVPEFPDEPDAG